MRCLVLLFFFNNTSTTEIYTLSLHDALPISALRATGFSVVLPWKIWSNPRSIFPRSEEHTSELQSLTNLVCRLLLEKKKQEQNEEARTRAVHCTMLPQEAQHRHANGSHARAY